MSEKSELKSELVHDLLNFVAAAKLNTEMAGRHKDLPEPVKKYLDRIASNLLSIQERLGVAAQNELPARTKATAMTVLVIDDSPDIRGLFKAVLKPLGYIVTVAKDLDEALSALANPPFPNLILLDYTLGEMTATDVLDALEAAKSPALTESKIVMLTGHGDSVKDSRVLAVEQKAMGASALIAIVQKYSKLAP